MTLAEATREYWRFSQHLAALKTEEQKEQFLMFTVGPTIANSPCQLRRKMLGKLMSRDIKVAIA